MRGEWTQYNRSAAALYRYLDREEIEQQRLKNSRKFFRQIKSPRLRAFAMALKYEMMHDPECNELNICKKVVSRCKISIRTYFYYLSFLQ